MNPITHLLSDWVVANTAHLSRRDRILVTLASVVPDADGIGVIAEIATENTSHVLLWWSKYHHVLFHNIGFGLVVIAGVFLLAVRRWMSALLAVVAFHLHLLGDLVGSKGPEGYHWPIPYLLPFCDRWQFTWSGQWELNAWPNVLITAFLFAITLRLAWQRGYSPLEIVSKKMDGAFISAWRKKFGVREPSKIRPD